MLLFLTFDTLRKSKSNEVNFALPNSSYAFGLFPRLLEMFIEY